MDIGAIIKWIVENWELIIDVWAKVIALASVITLLTPTLKDDDVLKGLIRFVGKYLALNTNKGSNPNG